jgi:hypothetical protein
VTVEIMRKSSLLRLGTMVAMNKCLSIERRDFAGQRYVDRAKQSKAEVVLAYWWLCTRVCPLSVRNCQVS